MIAFVTLLLGLISGVYPVEVTVSGPVAAVELQLDGVTAARVEAPPWIGRVDLGSDLRPRELVARALDADGAEIARVIQRLNLPRPPAEVEIVLENGEDGAPRAAVLTWQSVNGVKPSAIGLTLDGEPLAVDEQGRAALPPRDLKSIHILTAELGFPPGLLARQDVVYGGEYGSEVSTELTAVPVRVRGEAVPSPEALAGWFSAASGPLSVAAVEDGPGKVVVVRVPDENEIVHHLVAPRRRPGLSALRNEMRLGPQDQVRLLSLSSSRYRDSKVPAELFDMSRQLSAQDGGIFWFLTSLRMLNPASGQARRVADAVAVAGLQAAAENYRRAVVLVVGREVEDGSRYGPATVRGYLESIRVPLFVWSLYGAKAPAARVWPGAEDVSSLPKLQQAVARLRAELEAQKIVWVEGRHLPRSIILSPAATRLELVGGAPRP